jgi:hypothetical protein
MKLVLIFPFTSIGIALVVSPASFDGLQVCFHYVRFLYPFDEALVSLRLGSNHERAAR